MMAKPMKEWMKIFVALAYRRLRTTECRKSFTIESDIRCRKTTTVHRSSETEPYKNVID